MPMMADEVDRLMDGACISVIMEWPVRFALQRSREHRMRDRMVPMARISMTVLDLRMHVDPRHHEQPERDPEEQCPAGPC
jgi:hypothetical protein